MVAGSPCALSTATHKKSGPAASADPDKGQSDEKNLALRELRALAGLLEAVLLALDGTGVTGEEASLLELLAVLASLEKSAGDTKTKGAGLAVDAAAIAASEDVEGLGGLSQTEGRSGVVNKLLTAKVLCSVAAVDDDLALRSSDFPLMQKH